MEEFTRRKIEHTRGWGEELRKKREENKLSLKDASRSTHIQIKYLEAMENDEYEKLPARVYAVNFLLAYSKYLGLDAKKIVERYVTELEVSGSIQKKMSGEKKTKRFFSVCPRTIRTAFFAVGGIMAVCYVFLRLYGLMSPPVIHVVYPPSVSFGTTEDLIEINGSIERGIALTVNGEPIYINEDGTFAKELFLSEGTNVFELILVNRFEKETKEYIKINRIAPLEEND